MHVLTSSALSSKYGHFWFPEKETAKLKTSEVAAHKPTGNATVRLNFIQTEIPSLSSTLKIPAIRTEA